MPSRFIAFEGIDGSGKSTTLACVAAALRARWPDLVVTREETDALAGVAVREAIARRADPLAIAYLFLADRAMHTNEIRAHLAAGRHVLCDRYSLSTLAYQSVALKGRLSDPVATLRQLQAPIGLAPDHTLLFVADPERCVRRAERRGATTPYERATFLSEVQQAYLRVSEGDLSIVRLDAERELAGVVEDATRTVEAWLSS